MERSDKVLAARLLWKSVLNTQRAVCDEYPVVFDVAANRMQMPSAADMETLCMFPAAPTQTNRIVFTSPQDVEQLLQNMMNRAGSLSTLGAGSNGTAYTCAIPVTTLQYVLAQHHASNGGNDDPCHQLPPVPCATTSASQDVFRVVIKYQFVHKSTLHKRPCISSTATRAANIDLQAVVEPLALASLELQNGDPLFFRDEPMFPQLIANFRLLDANDDHVHLFMITTYMSGLRMSNGVDNLVNKLPPRLAEVMTFDLVFQMLLHQAVLQTHDMAYMDVKASNCTIGVDSAFLITQQQRVQNACKQGSSKHTELAQSLTNAVNKRVQRRVLMLVQPIADGEWVMHTVDMPYTGLWLHTLDFGFLSMPLPHTPSHALNSVSVPARNDAQRAALCRANIARNPAQSVAMGISTAVSFCMPEPLARVLVPAGWRFGRDSPGREQHKQQEQQQQVKSIEELTPTSLAVGRLVHYVCQNVPELQDPVFRLAFVHFNTMRKMPAHLSALYCLSALLDTVTEETLAARRRRDGSSSSSSASSSSSSLAMDVDSDDESQHNDDADTEEDKEDEDDHDGKQYAVRVERRVMANREELDTTIQLMKLVHTDCRVIYFKKYDESNISTHTYTSSSATPSTTTTTSRRSARARAFQAAAAKFSSPNFIGGGYDSDDDDDGDHGTAQCLYHDRT